MRQCGRTAMVALLMLVIDAVPALAHTRIVGTVPANGAVLEQSPPVIEIHFEHPVHMTAVVLLETGKAERKLEFAPHGGATSFTLTDPRLGPGRNEIRWKALAGDGHVISGSLIFTIEAATPKNH